ncbi:MAG: hypothetical protein ACC726_08730 [Chloroflexota bacterium]
MTPSPASTSLPQTTQVAAGSLALLSMTTSGVDSDSVVVELMGDCIISSNLESGRLSRAAGVARTCRLHLRLAAEPEKDMMNR